MVLTNVSVLTYYLRNGRGGGAGSTGCVQLMFGRTEPMSWGSTVGYI